MIVTAELFPSPLQAFAPYAQQEGAFLFYGTDEQDDPTLCWGAQPLAVLKISGQEKNALSILAGFIHDQELWQESKPQRIAVGYFAYEFGRHFLPQQNGIPAFRNETLGGFPDLWLGVYENFHCSRIATPPCNPSPSECHGHLQTLSNFSKIEFECAVSRILEYIRQGDLYQANLAQCFTLPWQDKDPYRLFQALIKKNPAPYSAYLHLDAAHTIVSCSPESFLNVRGDKIATEPIKGTMARGHDPACDEENRLALIHSAKNRAELTMIVDLLRNDLGKICVTGSIQTARSPQLKTFASVHHLVGKIEGKLLHGITLPQILQATFPGGSITGAPKLRAAQVIAELEKTPRGVYCGAMGVIGPGQKMDFNIAIRTLILTQNQVHVHAGAGIVAESNPQEEYAETLAKIAPILKEIRNV